MRLPEQEADNTFYTGAQATAHMCMTQHSVCAADNHSGTMQNARPSHASVQSKLSQHHPHQIGHNIVHVRHLSFRVL